MDSEPSPAGPEARLETLLRARCPLVWVESPEEERFERVLIRLGERLGIRVALWSVSQGLTDAAGEPLTGAEETREPAALLRFLAGSSSSAREVYLLRDLAPHLGEPLVARRLRELVRALRAGGKTCLVIGPEPGPPLSVRRVCERFRFPLPSRSELRHVLQSLLQGAALTFSEEEVAAAAAAVEGLTEIEAETAFACALVTGRRLDPAELEGARRTRLGDLRELTPPPA